MPVVSTGESTRSISAPRQNWKDFKVVVVNRHQQNSPVRGLPRKLVKFTLSWKLQGAPTGWFCDHYSRWTSSRPWSTGSSGPQPNWAVPSIYSNTLWNYLHSRRHPRDFNIETKKEMQGTCKLSVKKWMNHLLKCNTCKVVNEGKPDIPSASKNKKLKGIMYLLVSKSYSAIFGAGAYRI